MITSKKLIRIINTFLSIIYLALFIEYIFLKTYNTHVIMYYTFYGIFLIYVFDVFVSILRSNFRLSIYLPDFAIIFFFMTIVHYQERLLDPSNIIIIKAIVTLLIQARVLYFILSKTFLLVEYKQNSFLTTPAKTVLSSYVLMMLLGGFLLIMPISLKEDVKIHFIDAIFTAVSASSVTGLAVVDTNSTFSLFGKIVILSMIQLGGLGIMIFSYSITFLFGRKLTLEDQVTLSYVMDEENTKSLYKNIKTIVKITLSIELLGAILLFIFFSSKYGISFKAFFHSVFHSVSAFCNAGFALYSDSFMGFASSPFLIFTISALIILGSLGFSVFHNLLLAIYNSFRKGQRRRIYLTTNSKIVLITTIVLLAGGLFIIYTLEYTNSLYKLPRTTQYLSAFFQSVTLRTAGFNTMDFGNMTIATYFIMLAFMLIGGAAGSTAGGIKVNTVAVLFANLKAFVLNKDRTTLFKHQVSKKTINKAFLIFFVTIVILFISIFFLTITENFELKDIIFESVSAFATVGVSTGITSKLTFFGKVIIMSLMFIGKIGLLTILTAYSAKQEKGKVKYKDSGVILQ